MIYATIEAEGDPFLVIDFNMKSVSAHLYENDNKDDFLKDSRPVYNLDKQELETFITAFLDHFSKSFQEPDVITYEQIIGVPDGC